MTQVKMKQVIMKSCNNCSKLFVCKFVPELSALKSLPSIEITPLDFESMARELWGRFCLDYSSQMAIRTGEENRER